MNENVNVCITPKGDKPVLHFSQFDNENVFTVTVLADDGESAAVLTGLDIEFRLRKTDSHVVTIAPESVTDNVITFKTTEQMCACCGQNIASVTLMKDDMIISTLDIFVEIQRDILSGGLTSESDIRNLTTQIEQIVPEVIGDDYYTKTEVDELIADIPTFDPSNYYNKSDVDGLLADKADAADVYTKTETDNLLADKADADDVYAKSEVYNKTETDNLLSAKMDNIGYNGIVDDAAIISFNTDSEAPLAIIKGNITPVQSGSGTPSPDNVRPISGFSALNVTRTGVNLWDEVAEVGAINGTTGENQTGSTSLRSKNYIKVSPSNNVYLKMPSAGAWIYRYDKNKSYLGRLNYNANSVVTIPNDCEYIRFELYSQYGTTYNNDISINYPSSDTEYHAYKGQTATVDFGQTVYKGVADVTNGKVTITHKIVDLSTLSWLYNGSLKRWEAQKNNMKSYGSRSADVLFEKYETDTTATAGSEGKGFIAGLVIYIASTDSTTPPSGNACYPLATPIEISTTPVTVSSIAGDNNIYIDTGNLTEIAYFEDVEDNLIKLIKACQI